MKTTINSGELYVLDGSAPLARSAFLIGIAFSAAAVCAGRSSAAGTAVSGPWCRELTKVARNDIIDFSLHVLDSDNVFSLEELAGRPVWLQFFASWCGPCNAEAGAVNRIAANYGDAVHVAGIDVREEPEAVRAYRDRHKIVFPIALDQTGHVFKQLGFTTIPTHVFFDARGLVSCISIGDLTADEMDNEIAAALARSGGKSAR